MMRIFDTKFSLTITKKFIADEREILSHQSHLSGQRVNALKHSWKSEFEPNDDQFTQLLYEGFARCFAEQILLNWIEHLVTNCFLYQYPSQNLSLITTDLNSFCHEAFCQMFCFANVVELNRTPRNKLLSVWPHCFIIQANIIATVVLHIQQIKSKPGDGREAPLWSKPRNLHATSKKRNYNGSKPWCVNANVRKKQLHHRSNSRRAPS